MTCDIILWNICASAKSTKFCRVDVLQELHIVIVVMMSSWQHTPYQISTFLKWKMCYLLLQSLTHFLLLVLCNIHIRLHPLNEQQDQITLLAGGKLWFSSLNEEGLEPIVLPWKYHSGHIMELYDKCNNCTKFQLYTEKVVRDIQFFVILHHLVSTKWRHKLSNLHKSNS